MRSQSTNPSAKKGALNKTTFKASSPTKQVKKKSVTSKKVKNVIKKSLVKIPKKKLGKKSANKNKSDEYCAGEQSEGSDHARAGPSKSLTSRSNSPNKKTKKDPKEKKDPVKSSTEIVKDTRKKSSSPKKVKSILTPKSKPKSNEQINSNIKYKLNTEIFKLAKTKTQKRGKQGNSKKIVSSKTLERAGNSSLGRESNDSKEISRIKNKEIDPKVKKAEQDESISTEYSKCDRSSDLSYDASSPNMSGSSVSSTQQAETPKSESERPPKFFTSTRSPRTVDIDVKCCKTSKGSLAVSERFVSTKCIDSKSDECNTSNLSNNLITQGPEMDVYTFTEKVDSPKSILSDFRNPVNKNVGRVRPIARVKGTVIDKKLDSERKKYSPHRPIEEVVKLLKANKRSEELKTQIQNKDTDTTSDSSKVTLEKSDEEKPKPIISKSYKMVARKSSIPGKPFSPMNFMKQEDSMLNNQNKKCKSKKSPTEVKTKVVRSLSDEELDNSTFLLSSTTKSVCYSSSDESASECNDDNSTKKSSESDSSKTKKNTKMRKYKRITDGAKKNKSKELKALSKDSLVDLKDESYVGKDKPTKRRLKLLSMWTGPKKHRMASLNAIAKVHCLYENESRTHMELGLMKTVDRHFPSVLSKPSTSKKNTCKSKDMEKEVTTSESDYDKSDKKEESSEDDCPPRSTRTLRGEPGIRSAGKYWDPKSSTSSSDDSEMDTKKNVTEKKKATTSTTTKSDTDKPQAKMKKTAGVPVKKKRVRNEIVMDLKDMVVQKRMASLNATAILAASYEKRSPKSSRDETTSDSCSDESFSSKSKNGVVSGVKSESKNDETKKESEDDSSKDKKQKLEVIVNQDTDVTITGVYSTHLHEGFCTVSGMQYRISSTSHTQTTATANCEKECASEEGGSRYTPLTALSSMQPPPAEQPHAHPHPVAELGGLGRRAGCSSAFSTPSTAAHHEPGKPYSSTCALCDTMKVLPQGYYQPAGPLIKEGGAESERSLARYHPPPHYHAPHPPVLQQYGAPYYPSELCYGRYYRAAGPYMPPPPPPPESQMVGVGGEPYPPQYYGAPPCYQHSPQRVPYIEYRGCPCPMNACPKNVLIGPATGKAPTGGGPADVLSALAPPGGAFRAKVRAACAFDTGADAHGSGKDPPLEPDPPAAAGAPRPCPLPSAIGGASPKREMYDVRDIRVAGDIVHSSEAAGPPSPARGSAGACAPQGPPAAPRRARLGKDMARRTLAGDDTDLLLSAHQPPPPHADADDDVLAVSPPACPPIDISSSDEIERRSTPLVDVKKENEGPTNSSPRKTDTQALREHNCTAVLADSETTNAAKAVKRRYSRPKLEIDMREAVLEDACKTNGIGEHVKLQKRRKVASEQNDVAIRSETVTLKETKKKTSPKAKRALETEKHTTKRKSGLQAESLLAKRLSTDKTVNEICRFTGIDDKCYLLPKTKSALLLDKLIRKNSVERPKGEREINPAELFLPTSASSVASTCVKSTLNINNNVIDNSERNNVVRINTEDNQPLENRLVDAKSVFQLQNVESKVVQRIKTVKNVPKASDKNALLKETANKIDKLILDGRVDNDNDPKVKTIMDTTKGSLPDALMKLDNSSKSTAKGFDQTNKVTKYKAAVPVKQLELETKIAHTLKSNASASEIKEISDAKISTSQKQTYSEDAKLKVDNGVVHLEKTKRNKLVEKANGEIKSKCVEKVVCDKVAKLLVPKKCVIKSDEAAQLVEEACASPVPSGAAVEVSSSRRARRSRCGRPRRTPAPPPPPPAARAPPRWSNGWHWDGDDYVSKVYLNNDSRLDRSARCYPRMTHASGDQIARGDCVLLRASSARAQPFVARIARLWENPEDGEMMVSLVWYYRPEHTERGRQCEDAPDEVFASRHRDANSVACIEDKCYVLTYNEYCRYRKKLKAAEEGISVPASIVPPLTGEAAGAAADARLPPSVSPELVLFCRKIYDFRSKKLQAPNK